MSIFLWKEIINLRIHETEWVKSIISLIKKPANPKKKLKSLAWITYLCKNMYVSGQHLVGEGAIPVILECLDLNDVQIFELAIKTIGIILKNDQSCMDQVEKTTVLEKLVIVLQAKKDDIIASTNWN